MKEGETIKSGPWAGFEVVSVYTRAQAIADGVLISGNVGELEEVSRQHFPRTPIAMTAAVFDIIKRAVENPKSCNSYKGVWHDVLWMSRTCSRAVDESTCLFLVKITTPGRRSLYQFKIVCHAGDHGEPVLTVVLRDQAITNIVVANHWQIRNCVHDRGLWL